MSQWTSYQEDVGQFLLWVERVEETLSSADRQYSEMRDKTANLGKTKVRHPAGAGSDVDWCHVLFAALLQMRRVFSPSSFSMKKC